jgi:glycine/sarcosine N-methyltransferase
MLHHNRVDEFHDAIAEYYPYFYRDWETQLQREGLGLRAIFRNRGVTRILDASCRAGAQTIPLAQLGYEIVATDSSAGMLRKLQEIAAQYNVLDKIQRERVDILHLPEIVSAPFDAIVSKGNALAELLLDAEIETALINFYRLLRPGGTLVIGMRDFGAFMQDRPRFIPGFIHEIEDGEELITFDTWEWRDGPPIIATQHLFLVQGKAQNYKTIKRSISYRPLSTDEVKVVLLEVGFEDIQDQPDRAQRILIARKPLTAAK